MEYINGKEILPDHLLDLLQDYIQGAYLYIPKRDQSKASWGEKTRYKKELTVRNKHIFSKYLEGSSIDVLADHYHLSVKTVQHILTDKRKEMRIIRNTMEQLLKQWNITGNLIQITETTWEINHTYVLKINYSKEMTVRNAMTMRILYQHGIPAARVIPTVDGKLYLEDSGKCYILTEKLLGKNITNLFEQENFLQLADITGKILAKLHSAFRECEMQLDYWDNDLMNEMQGWVTDTLQSHGYQYISEYDVTESIKHLENCNKELPRQLIHRDPHYGNLLFDQGKFTGFIDFDLSQKNIRIFDLCYFLLGLIVGHENEENYVRQWYEYIRYFMSGYNSADRLSEVEKNNISYVMENIEILFTAYFLNENDYELAESAARTYHFIHDNRSEITERIMI